MPDRVEAAIFDSEPGLDSGQDSMRLLAEGDLKALQSLVDRWKQPLCSFFYRSVFNQEDAEELALRTFEQLYRGASRYRPIAPFPSYLFTIARNQLISHARRRKLKTTELTSAPEAIDPDQPAQTAERKEAAQLLEKGLAQLSEPYRTPLLLFVQQGLSLQEVSDVLNQPLSRTKVQIHRARKQLKSFIETAKS